MNFDTNAVLYWGFQINSIDGKLPVPPSEPEKLHYGEQEGIAFVWIPGKNGWVEFIVSEINGVKVVPPLKITSSINGALGGS